MIMDNWALLYW